MPKQPEVPTEAPKRPSDNHAPELIALNVPATAKPGESVVVSVQAADIDGDELSYQWQVVRVSGGRVEAAQADDLLANATQSSALLTLAPDVKACRVSVTVRDPLGATVTSKVVDVVADSLPPLNATLTRADGTSTSLDMSSTTETQKLLRGEEVTLRLGTSDFEYSLEDLTGVGWVATRISNDSLRVKAAAYPFGAASLSITSAGKTHVLQLEAINRAPMIHAILAPSSVEVGSAASLSITASDPDGDPIYYSLKQSNRALSYESQSQPESSSSSFVLETRVPLGFKLVVGIRDSYGASATQAVDFDVTSPMRLVHTQPRVSTAGSLADLAVYGVGLFLARVGNGTATIERVDVTNGTTSQVGSFAEATQARFLARDGSMFVAGSRLYALEARGTWTAVTPNPPCDSLPQFGLGSSVFAAYLCQGEVVTQTLGAGTWTELERYSTGGVDSTLERVAANGRHLWLALANLSNGRQSSIVCCPADASCELVASLDRINVRDVLVDAQGTAFVAGSSLGIAGDQLWRFAPHEEATPPTRLTAVALSMCGDMLCLVRAGRSDECGSFDCTVIERHDGTNWLRLGLLPGWYGVAALALSERTLYVAGEASGTTDVYAIDLGEQTP